ncbi:MAG: ribbon-helix-helix protein, CopG family [Deltaproteobacteria bacterium]|nr:ribbon-helix-helix protein, CopG family [Deltaproteobacteria bacterium]
MTIDDSLLERLDADAEVKRDGRSAVLRRAALTYLKQKRKRDIAAAYRHAYGRDKGRDPALSGWEQEGLWPKE